MGSLNPLVPISTTSNSTRSSPNSTAKTLMTLFPKVWVSSPPFHLVVLLQLPVVPPLPLVPVKPPPPKRRKKNPKPSPTPTWALISLDKKNNKDDLVFKL